MGEAVNNSDNKGTRQYDVKLLIVLVVLIAIASSRDPASSPWTMIGVGLALLVIAAMLMRRLSQRILQRALIAVLAACAVGGGGIAVWML